MLRPPTRRLATSPPFWVRLGVVLLALLQIVAPNWHTCAGGFTGLPPRITVPTPDGNLVALSGSLSNSVAASAAPRCPMCLYRPAAASSKTDGSGPALSALPLTREGTCLARLLDSMPGQTGVAPALFFCYFLVEAPYSPWREQAPALAPLHRYRGRAPPSRA